MAGRGIFVKRNGNWVSVDSPSVNDNGSWANIKAGYVNQNGQWNQFWPPNVTADILVVAGGGGGGIGYGWEGGGGGGAGGVIYRENIVLSCLDTYYTIVGAGGGANNNGQNSYFGLTPSPQVYPATDVPVYPYSYPVYNGFLNTYGVWTNQSFESPVGSWVTVNYTTSIARTASYRLVCSADNHIRVIINGNTVGSNDNWGTTNTSYVTLQAGIQTITCQALNDGGPASFSAALYDNLGNAIWHTRSLGSVVVGDPLLAIGGGNGGWGIPEQTAGSGGSGGGGCGYVYTHAGGSGTPGQGNDGGTGIWQGFGQAGGGGGGGAGAAGAQSNGNQGGQGGTGIRFVTKSGEALSVGGGGGGGYGNQGPSGTGPGGAGGGGGGGAGNGGNGENGTGGGGGGSMHSALTGAGSGGSGIIAIQYKAPSAFFTGGEISVVNGYVTHKFANPGNWTLAP